MYGKNCRGTIIIQKLIGLEKVVVKLEIKINFIA